MNKSRPLIMRSSEAAIRTRRMRGFARRTRTTASRFGKQGGFPAPCATTRLDGMSFARMSHSMAVDVDVFAGLRDLSIVEHRAGDAVRVSIGPESDNLGAGECFLLPPDQPYQAGWNSVIAEVAVVPPRLQLMRWAWSLARQSTSFHPAHHTGRWPPLVPNHPVRARFRHNSPLLAAALARRELGWLSAVQSWRFPTRR